MLKIADKPFISGLNGNLVILAYTKLQELFQVIALRLKETLFLAVEKLIKQRLAGSILKGDNKGAKGLLIEAYTNIGIATDPLVSTVAVVVVKAVVKDVAKAVVKTIATFGTITNTSAKAKEKVEVEKDAFIKKQFYVFLKVGILLFIMASALLIIFT